VRGAQPPLCRGLLEVKYRNKVPDKLYGRGIRLRLVVVVVVVEEEEG